VLVRTDDEVYRVDAVWLGPPRATFPWRARYVSYGLGLFVMIVVMFVQRRIGISLDFFSVAWALLLTIVITRFIGKRINYDRPLGQIVSLFRHEVTGPRERTAVRGGVIRTGRVTVRQSAPLARTARRKGSSTGPRGHDSSGSRVVDPAAARVAEPAGPRAAAQPPRPWTVGPGRAAPVRVGTPGKPDEPSRRSARGGRRIVGRTPPPPARPVRTVADHVNGTRGGPA
jgi:hypothetical protein